MEKSKSDYKQKPKKMLVKDKDALGGVKVVNKMSGGMAIGGGHKNYKMTGTVKAKTGKLVGKQKNLPKHLQKAILA